MLRVGIMCRGESFHAWEAGIIRDLISYKDISIELLILDEMSPKNFVSLLRKISRKYLFWQIFYRLSSRKMTCDKIVDMKDELKDVDKFSCQPILKGRFSQYFSNEDLDHIRNYDLDVILRFGFNIIRGKILESAKYGVWSYHHDDNTRYRGMPASFWEIYNTDPLTGAILQQLTDVLDAGRIIERGYFSTLSHSYAKNRNQVLNASAAWVPRACRRIIDCPSSSLFASIPITNGNSDDEILKEKTQLAPIYGLPTNSQMVRFIFQQFWNIFTRRVHNAIYKPCWSIGIVRRNLEDPFQINQLDKVTWIPSPKNSFFADPFVIESDGNNYIFFEEYLYSQFSGRISMIETNDFKSFSNSEVVLEQEFHLSYPNVFEHDGRYFCIPEQAESGKMVLYEAHAFPRGWKETATIIKFPGLDPTVIRENGKWWLFAGRDGGDNSELFLWHATDLIGPWHPHPQNPVKTDVRSSRPGGRPFLRDGKWIRPAQDCSTSYGSKIVFNEILTMSDTCYEERSVHSLNPNPKGELPDGLHTLDSTSGFFIIDGLVMKKSWRYAFLYLMNRFSRIANLK